MDNIIELNNLKERINGFLKAPQTECSRLPHSNLLYALRIGNPVYQNKFDYIQVGNSSSVAVILKL